MKDSGNCSVRKYATWPRNYSNLQFVSLDDHDFAVVVLSAFGIWWTQSTIDVRFIVVDCNAMQTSSGSTLR